MPLTSKVVCTTCIHWKRNFFLLGQSIMPFPGLVNSVPFVAYHFCLNLPAAFWQPGNGLIVQLFKWEGKKTHDSNIRDNFLSLQTTQLFHISNCLDGERDTFLCLACRPSPTDFLRSSQTKGKCPFTLQAQSVTVTPQGTAKSVTVSVFHCNCIIFTVRSWLRAW